jgi:DNA invertase Pin-like site-specific DNA recombinase
LDRYRLRFAALLIARLERLAHNVHFMSRLMEIDVNLVAADTAGANRLIVHILAAATEHERGVISHRTRDAFVDAVERIAI